MKGSDLRLTDTNSADDSAGRTWGLDGGLFWFVVAGVFAFVVTLLFLFSALRAPFWSAFGLASVPLVMSLLYVFGFRQGKPPGYDVDLVDYWVNGSGFGPRPRSQGMRGRGHVAD